MVPEIVVHAGIHKTGSTAIQTALFHRPEVFRPHGIYYPQTGLFDGAHHLIAQAARRATDSGDGRRLLDELKSELTGRSERVVLSSEDLDALDQEGIGRLHQWLSPLAARVRVLIYVRPQYSLIRSQYSQQIREGYIRTSFDAFFLQAIRHARFLKLAHLLENWVTVFGKANVTVRSAVLGDLEGKSSLTDFISYLELASVLSADAFRLPKSINESLNLVQCDVLRQLSFVQEFWSLPFERRREILVRFFRTSKSIQALGAVADPPDHRGILLCSLMYKDENAAIATKHLQGKDRLNRWYADMLSRDAEDTPPMLDSLHVPWKDVYADFYRAMKPANPATNQPKGN